MLRFRECCDLFVQHYFNILDWRSVEGEIAQLGLLGFLVTVMNAQKKWFYIVPLDLPRTDEDILEQLAEYTLSADLFGHTRDHSVAQRNAGERLKASLLRQTLFPPAEQIESRYTFLQGRRWLLPIAGGARILANGGRIGKRWDDLKKIAGAEQAEVEAYNKFMTKVGL